MKNYYKILGIRETASGEDIRTRWIELMRRFHPDRAMNGRVEDPRVKEINEAYGVLKHSSTRFEYDLQRAYHRKKITSLLRRLMFSPGILIVLLILGLIYVQWIRVAPLAKPSLPLARGVIHIKPIPPINEADGTDSIDQKKQTSQRQSKAAVFLPGVKKKGPAKTPSSSRPGKLKNRNRENQINETKQTNEINQTDQTPFVLAAKAEISAAVPKPALLLNQPKLFNKIDVTNQINQTNEINQINQIVAQPEHPPLIATEEEVKQFFAQYREQYNQMDIEGFLSLFSSSVVQNQRDGIDEMRRIYSDFFDESLELWIHTEDMRIEIYQNAVQVNARYEIYQILKKKGKKRSWSGYISWILIRENGALKIRSLDFKPHKSR